MEDLSYNAVELQVLKSHCTFLRHPTREYGYDATVITFNEKGEVEPDLIFVQVKATDKLKYSAKNKGFELVLDKRDLNLWLEEVWPILIALYDGGKEVVYFVEIHEYFKENRLILKQINKYKTIFIPRDNILTPDVVNDYRVKKNKIHGIFKKLQGDGTNI